MTLRLPRVRLSWKEPDGDEGSTATSLTFRLGILATVTVCGCGTIRGLRPNSPAWGFVRSARRNMETARTNTFVALRTSSGGTPELELNAERSAARRYPAGVLRNGQPSN